MRSAWCLVIAMMVGVVGCGHDRWTYVDGLPTHDLEMVNGLGLSGVLRDHEGCLYLGTPGEETVLVFPEGFSRVGDEIIGPDGAVAAAIGDTVDTGGTQDNSGGPCTPPSGSPSVLFMGELGPSEFED